MAEVSAALVKELREKSGAGMMDCKQALAEANGDIAAAIEVLRKKGLKTLGKRSDKVAAEGVIGVYTHPGDQIVAIVELNCETDFVARNDDFKSVARDLAMHVAAMKPSYIAEGDVPASVIEKEKEILLASLTPEQQAKADKIIPGKMNAYFAEHVLLAQPFVKDDSGKKTVANILEELAIRCGEKVTLRRVVRYEVGEGIEKNMANLAEEVAAMTGVQ